jgi:hypothetical protein
MKIMRLRNSLWIDYIIKADDDITVHASHDGFQRKYIQLQILKIASANVERYAVEPTFEA